MRNNEKYRRSNKTRLLPIDYNRVVCFGIYHAGSAFVEEKNRERENERDREREKGRALQALNIEL